MGLPYRGRWYIALFVARGLARPFPEVLAVAQPRSVSEI